MQRKKILIVGDEVRAKLIEGVNELANIVKPTLGPRGQNVVIERQFMSPLITNDGVTIAKQVELSNREKNLGAMIMKEVASKTNDSAGDGTTSATVLAQSMANEGLKQTATNVNPIILRKGMLAQSEQVAKDIVELSRPISSRDDYAHVATISSGSEAIGQLIADAMMVVGKDGIVTLTDSPNMETSLTTVEGYQIDAGIMSPHFYADVEKQRSQYEDAQVLISLEPIRDQTELAAILQSRYENKVKKPLVIIAPEIEREPLALLAINHLQNGMTTLPINAPAIGDIQISLLKDIATYTNASIVDSSIGLSMSDIAKDLSLLGNVDRISATKDETQLIMSDLSQGIDGYIESLRTLKKDAKGMQADLLDERIAKLQGKAAMVHVGAQTKVQLEETKLRIEDALNATQAAAEEGIVAGGGATLAHLAHKYEQEDYEGLPEELAGRKIVIQALKMPLKVIAENSGVSADVVFNEVIVRNIKENGTPIAPNQNIVIGYDAYTDTYVSMFDKGIIDPAKVTKSAVLNAVSVVSTLLTSKGMIIFEGKDEPEVKSMMNM